MTKPIDSLKTIARYIEAKKPKTLDEAELMLDLISVIADETTARGNAGIPVIKRIENHTVADWERVIETNLTSLYVLARASAVHMAAGGYGRIINVASVMGIVARSGIISYVAAKHGVIGLTKALAAEFAMKNINSNAIAPGYFLTEINKSVQDDKAFYELVKSRTPLHRWGSPEELAGPVQFLASPASSFVNGHILVVDGGMCATNLEPPVLP